MTRICRRPTVAVGLVAALLAYVGCSRPSPTGGESPGQGSGASAAKPAGPEAVVKKAGAGQSTLADWPKPLAALVISGEQLGYLEPCGCTQGQLGGLLRRYELVDRLNRDQKWPLALVDLGSLVRDPAVARGGPEQTKIKFHIALKALAALKYDALALSPEDLKVGVDEAVGQFLNLPGDRLKVVAANVSAAGLEARVVPSVRVKAGPVSIGITAVVDPEKLKALRDPSLDLLAVKPIDDALPGVLSDLEKNTQMQVLLVQAAPDSARSLAEKYPGFDVVVCPTPNDSPPDDAERLNGGKTLLVQVGQKGKYVGVVGVFDDPSRPYRYQRVTLGTRYDGEAKPLKAIVEGEFRETLKTQGVVENFPRHDVVSAAPGAAFVGAESCKDCHKNTYERWAGTKHARAYASLEKDPKPNAVFDAECVTCHTTGFEYTSGWKSPDLTAFLKGNQCENCHGPASKHVEAPDDKTYLSALHLTADQADKTRLCLRCHDEDNSPHFDFAKYYAQIVHKGLDDYQDPRSHKGRPAKVATPMEGTPR